MTDLPVIQIVSESGEKSTMYLNSENKFYLNIMESLGKRLRKNVDPETGELLSLEGTRDEIMAAQLEFNERVTKMESFLKERGY